MHRKALEVTAVLAAAAIVLALSWTLGFVSYAQRGVEAITAAEASEQEQ